MSNVEGQLGRGRPLGQPVFQQFGERSGVGMPGRGSGERRGSEQLFSLDRPVDIEGTIRGFVNEAKAQHRGEFNTAWWLRSKVRDQSEQMARTNRNASLFFHELGVAYDLIAYQRYPKKEEIREVVEEDLKTYRSAFDREEVKLNPLGVRLLDAMAEATGVPYTPGQDTFELSHVIGLLDYPLNH
jgi:hypothetical protein